MKFNNDWFLILIISMLIGVCHLQAAANPVDDHGDTYKEATELFFDSPEMGLIDTAGDIDYFRLEIPEPGELTVYTTGILDTIGGIKDDTGIVFVEGDQEGDGDNFRIVYNAKPETYYISVRGYGNATGDYTLHASFVPDEVPLVSVAETGETLVGTPQTDDHGDLWKTATEMFFDVPESGVIDTTEDVDYFLLEIPEPGALTVWTTGILDTIGSIEDDTGIAFVEGDQEGDGDNFRIVCAAKPETYYISVRGYENATGDYTLHASFVPGEDQFLVELEGVVADPQHGDTRATATPIPLGGSVHQGAISPAGDVDYWRVQVTFAAYLNITTYGTTDTFGRLEDSAGRILATNDDAGVHSNFRILHWVTAGTYYIRVTGYRTWTTGSYTLGVVNDLFGNTRATAASLPLNSSLDGTLNYTGVNGVNYDIDYFRMQVTASGSLTVYTTGSTDTVGRLENSAGSTLATNNDSGTGTNFRIVRNVTPGTYYIRVTGDYDSRTGWHRTGHYTIRANFTSTTPTTDDHGNTRATATSISLDSPQTGAINPAGDIDYFRLQVTASGSLTVETTGSMDTVGYLESSAGTSLADNDDSGVGRNFRIVHDVTAGTYYIRVTGWRTRTGNYTLNARLTSTTSPGDPGDTRATAASLPLNSPQTEAISPAGDIDYFRLEVTSAGELTVETTGTTDTVGRLESSSGSTLASNDDGGTGYNFRIVHDVTPGTYYVRVRGWSSSTTGSYTINASFSGTTGGISLRIPDDFITDVAFGDSGVYFVWNAQYLTLMEGSTPLNAIYGKCTITLDFEHTGDNTLDPTRAFVVALEYIQQRIRLQLPLDPVSLAARLIEARLLPDHFGFPEQAPYFMFPLLTPVEKLNALEDEINGRHLGDVFGLVIGLIPYASEILNATTAELARLRGIDEIFRSVLDPKIVLSPSLGDRIGNFFTGPTTSPPNDKLRYLIYIPDWRELDRTGGGVNIMVKVEQKYKERRLAFERTAEGLGTLNLRSNTWNAPSKQPMSLADYPPFQSLTLEAQDYLLSRFEAFKNFWGLEGLEGLELERWRLPEETSLLPNYPNPFNPETWIPYQLSEAADVTLTISDIHGRVVRGLDLGHQRAGVYHNRSRAAYWDGRNTQGEPVASGLYFYTLTAGDFTATRKMLIAK